MKTATKQTSEEKREYWRQRMDEYKTSGLSQQAYCKKEGLCFSTLSYWRWKLNKEKDIQSPGFLEAKLSKEASHHQTIVQLILPNGTKVGIPTQAGKELIVHVISEVGGFAC